jgi:NADPH-dependent F420 reductase
MHELETIAVIGGTGAEGSGLALRFAKAGYSVVVGSRDLAKAAKAAAELNGLLGGPLVKYQEMRPAAAAADIVVLTVPYIAQRAVLGDIQEALEGKILIDATAPLVPPNVNRVHLPPEGSVVAMAQAFLGPGVRVVSAFQNVAAAKLKKLGADVDCDVLVCGDDVQARATVIGLIERIGLRGLDAGPICNSIVAEALTSVLININRRYKVPGSGVRITGVGETKR